jgi:hypothetical protein
MKTSRMVLVVALLFGLVPSIAQAQEINRRGPCRADIEKFCKDVKPLQGRVVKCMREHEGELSQACKNHIAEAKEQQKEFVRDCKADASKFCKDVKPGGGRIINCLKPHQAELSAGCGAHFRNK